MAEKPELDILNPLRFDAAKKGKKVVYWMPLTCLLS